MDDLEARLSELKLTYQTKLPEKIATIESSWQAYKQDPTPSKLGALFRLTHNLSGSAGSYGFHEVSQMTQKIDDLLRNQVALESQQNKQIEVLIQALKSWVKAVGNHEHE